MASGNFSLKTIDFVVFPFIVSLDLNIIVFLYQICEELLDRCLATECDTGGVGCDNMTVILIALKQNGSYQQLCEKCNIPKHDPIPPVCLLASYPEYVRGGISCL